MLNNSSSGSRCYLTNLMKLALYLILLFSITGCSSFKYGIMPNVSALNQLQQGVSTRTEVQTLLGVPRGKGKTKFTAAIPYPFDIWFYEYAQTDGKLIDFKFLLVFMDKEVYQGYLWFSSKDLAVSEIQ